MNYKLLLFILIFGSQHLFAFQNDTTTYRKQDTVCFKYKFTIGDKLTFEVNSFDSISINYGQVLLRNRKETIQIKCDSLSKKGTFYLSQMLLSYKARESSGDEKNIERTNNSWIGRRISLEIDSVGNRLSFRFDDSTKAGLTPGGAYNPYLLFPISSTCKAIDESWAVSTTDFLPENGNPLPLLRQYSLLRVRKPIDTLGYFCQKLEFVKTSQGSYELPFDNKKITVNSVINGFGTLLISDSLKIPINFLATSEEKLTLIFSDEDHQPGFHYISTEFVLKEYIKGTGIKLRLKPVLKKHIPRKYFKKPGRKR